jgi:hypothetical protein
MADLNFTSNKKRTSILQDNPGIKAGIIKVINFKIEYGQVGIDRFVINE